MKSTLLYITLIIGLVFSEGSSSKLANFKFKTLDKKKIELKEFYKDGPIAVNVWNLSCEPCKKEMKYLDEYHKKYSDKGFEVVSINMDTPRGISKVKSYVKSAKFSFTVLSDPRAEFFRKTGGKVMPYLVLINSDGTIFKKKVGFTPSEAKKLEQDILDLMTHNKIGIDTSVVIIDSAATVTPIDSVKVETFKK